MYKIQYLLLWLLLISPFLLAGQTPPGGRPDTRRSNPGLANQRDSYRETASFYRSSAPRPGAPRPKARVRNLTGGPKSEPALPDNAPNPKPASVADRSPSVSVRRRKLRLHGRG